MGSNLMGLSQKKLFNKVQYRYNISLESFQTELYSKNLFPIIKKDYTNFLIKILASVKEGKEKNKICFFDLYFKERLKSREKLSRKNRFLVRYKQFNIHNLPLIEVANYLKIKVEKAIISKECYAYYNKNNRIIVLGSDCAQFFIHELAHAIDHILPGHKVDYHFIEIIAETTSILLCKIYCIPCDLIFSKNYLIYHARRSFFHTKEVMERVTQIIIFVTEIDRILKQGLTTKLKTI